MIELGQDIPRDLSRLTCQLGEAVHGHQAEGDHEPQQDRESRVQLQRNSDISQNRHLLKSPGKSFGRDFSGAAECGWRHHANCDPYPDGVHRLRLVAPRPADDVKSSCADVLGGATLKKS
jgi:hypothetical protein